MVDAIIQTLRVQDDAEVRDVAGKQVARVRCSRSQGKDKAGEWKPSIWFSVESWSSNPWSFNDLAALKKGQYIVAQGRLSMREYVNRDGATVQALSIEADRVDVLAERQQQGQTQRPNANPNARSGGYGDERREAPKSSPPGYDDDDQDIPF